MKASTKTNEALMGTIPPRVKRLRDQVALAVVVVSIGIFLLSSQIHLSASGQVLDADAQRSKLAFTRLLITWLALLPALAAVILFQYYPLARG